VLQQRTLSTSTHPDSTVAWHSYSNSGAGGAGSRSAELEQYPSDAAMWNWNYDDRLAGLEKADQLTNSPFDGVVRPGFGFDGGPLTKATRREWKWMWSYWFRRGGPRLWGCESEFVIGD